MMTLPGYETPLLVPREFTQRVVETFDRFDLHGEWVMYSELARRRVETTKSNAV